MNEKKKNPKKQSIPILPIVCLAVLILLIILSSALIKKAKANRSSEPAAETNSASTINHEVSEESSDTESSQDPSAPVSADMGAVAPETPDGTGTAGLLPMDEYMSSYATAPGWGNDGQNAWYTPDGHNCYYGGWQTIDDQSYHFDGSGLIDYGWKLIGGQGCYFDDNGVYHPDADPNKLLAFTFDDGPSHGMDEILELCEQTGARVTFFMIGKQVENGGAVLPHIIQDRCEVGNHSNTHTQMTKLGTEECAQNFRDCDEWIRSFSGGIESDAVRFPYGDYNPEQPAAVGKPSIMWSVDSLDWELLEAQPVIDTVLNQITEGDIILMHDRYESTVEACRYLFPYLIEQGYQLVTVKELAAAKGFELEAGKTYYGFCQNYIEENRVYQ